VNRLKQQKKKRKLSWNNKELHPKLIPILSIVKRVHLRIVRSKMLNHLAVKEVDLLLKSNLFLKNKRLIR
jgi:hypothetical protein